MGEREREIASLRAEKRQLENARFVLDNRIAELDAERVPVAEHVSRLEAQLRAMYDEMVAKFNRDQDSSIEAKSTKDRLGSLIEELKKERLAVRNRQQVVDSILRDVQVRKCQFLPAWQACARDACYENHAYTCIFDISAGIAPHGRRPSATRH